jgi:predicted RNase H-like HicB family nuclease
MDDARQYTYRSEWSAEDDAYVGTVAELPSLSYLDATAKAADAGIRSLTAGAVEDMLANGEVIPAAPEHSDG